MRQQKNFDKITIMYIELFLFMYIYSGRSRLFVYVMNLKIDVVLKASRTVVIRGFSLNEAPLGLFKFISDYLPYIEIRILNLDSRTHFVYLL
jgi:hypothetical protein